MTFLMCFYLLAFIVLPVVGLLCAMIIDRLIYGRENDSNSGGASK